jgi:Mg2+-importing ATPase
MTPSAPEDSGQVRSAAAAPGGLSSAEAAARLAQYGPNEPAPAKRGATVIELLVLFLNPLVVILLVASVVSLFLGQVADALIILIIVLLSIAIDFFQTYRSQKAIARLRENVTPTATVLRDGAWQEIRRREVVPGDVVRISAGDLVPADAELIEARDLYVQQAALTGESMPVEKDPHHTNS